MEYTFNKLYGDLDFEKIKKKIEDDFPLDKFSSRGTFYDMVRLMDNYYDNHFIRVEPSEICHLSVADKITRIPIENLNLFEPVDPVAYWEQASLVDLTYMNFYYKRSINDIIFHKFCTIQKVDKLIDIFKHSQFLIDRREFKYSRIFEAYQETILDDKLKIEIQKIQDEYNKIYEKIIFSLVDIKTLLFIKLNFYFYAGYNMPSFSKMEWMHRFEQAFLVGEKSDEIRERYKDFRFVNIDHSFMEIQTQEFCRSLVNSYAELTEFNFYTDIMLSKDELTAPKVDEELIKLFVMASDQYIEEYYASKEHLEEYDPDKQKGRVFCNPDVLYRMIKMDHFLEQSDIGDIQFTDPDDFVIDGYESNPVTFEESRGVIEKQEPDNYAEIVNFWFTINDNSRLLKQKVSEESLL